jgi:hypothetical protein
METSIFHSQIDFILKRGTGIKACLFDNETKSLISGLIPLSLFNENSYFHFDILSNEKKVKIKGMFCVVILRVESLDFLLQELVDPSYGNYIILFTSQVDPLILELMANADINSVISEVHELNLDLYRQLPHLYTTKPNNHIINSHRRSLEGIFSALCSLEINPEILIQQPNEQILKNNLSLLARDLQNKMACCNFNKKAVLILLNRNFDLLTPLVMDWSYLSLINEKLDFSEQIVKFDKKSFLLTDFFSIENLNENIAVVGENIKNLAKKVENEIEMKKMKKMGEIEEIEEIMKKKAVVETHLSIYNFLAVVENEKLIKFSEDQGRLLSTGEITSDNKYEDNKYEDNLGNNNLGNNNLGNNNLGKKIAAKDNVKKIADEKRNAEKLTVKKIPQININNNADDSTYELNLILIHFLKINFKDWNEKLKQFTKFKAEIIKLYSNYQPFSYKFSFDFEKDLKLAYTSPIKRMIKHVILNKIKENTFFSKKEFVFKRHYPLIIFIDGGITIREYREAMECANEFEVELILISTEILNIQKYITKLRE